MMGAPNGDVLTKIDDDTADAMAEFISNTCGGLVTELNSVVFEDLGKSKFNIKHKEILDGNSVESFENIYRFLIDIEGVNVVIFTEFEENFIGFITELTQAKQTFYPEVIKQEEVIEELEETNKKEELKIEEQKEGSEDKDTDPKSKKLKMVIIIIGGLIIFTILVGLIMYLSGAFSQKPIEKPIDVNTTIIEKNKVEIVKYEALKKVDFKMSDINVERLNSRFELLTKYQILTQEELEIQAQEEKQRIIQLKKEQELIEFAKQNKEEPLIIEENKENQKTDTIQKDIIEKPIENITTPISVEIQKIQPIENKEINLVVTNDKLKFVLANSLKYKLFKQLVQQTNSTQARISICNNNNGKTQIFIGPFENEELQIKMNTLIRESDTTVETLISNLTQEEFDTKCNF
jgi:hypothetical protein